MPSSYITDTITSGTTPVTLANFDELVITPTGQLVVTGSANAVTGDVRRSEIFSDGGIFTSSNAIDLVNTSATTSGFAHTITFGENASVYAGGNAIEATFDATSIDDLTVVNRGSLVSHFATVDFVGDNFRMVNYGYMSSAVQSALAADAENGVITNYGTIASLQQSDTTLFLFGNADRSTSAQYRIENYGVIEAEATVGSFGQAVQVALGTGVLSNELHMINSGTVNGNIFANNSTLELYNYEQINGNVFATGSTVSGNRIENYGVLNGTLSSDSGTVVINMGTLIGSVDTGDGADVVTNGGTIAADLLLGNDNDFFYALSGGTVDGLVSGQSGDDLLSATEHDAAVWVNADVSSGVGEFWTRGTSSLTNGSWVNQFSFTDFEIYEGTAYADVLIGGFDDESFTLDVRQHLGGVEQIDGGLGEDSLEIGETIHSIWIDLEYAGSQLWTRYSDTFQSGGTFVAIGAISNIETIYGAGGVDFVRGSAADETYVFSADNFYQDVIEVDGLGPFDIDLRGGADTVDFSAENHALWIDLNYTAGAQVQTKFLSSLSGGAWNELATLVSVEHVIGTIRSDEIRGSNEDNILEGGAGNDLLIGRGGNDTFVFRDGTQADVIQGFEANNAERIHIISDDITSFADLQANHISTFGGDLQISWNGGVDRIVVDGYTTADVDVAGALSSADFIFG